MGEVWLAEQQSIGTRVAIKLLMEQISKDTEHVQRFFNEARAVSRIQHAGIVKIFDVGHHAGRAYLIMEYLEGETLAARISRVGRLPLAEIADIGRQIASVLDATHNAGITHRDLKPDNIFLVPDRELPRGERVKVLDFGIAKLTGTLAGASPRTIGTMGTPAYMAPEQWGDASQVDWRADLYSLGCVAFEMTCGRPPFIVTNIAEACAKHLHEPPPAASSIVPNVPKQLEQLLARLLRKDPATRPKSMSEVARAFELIDKSSLEKNETVPLAAISTPLPTMPPARRFPVAMVAAVAGLVLLGAGVAGYLVVRGRKTETPTVAVADAAVAPDAAVALVPDAAIDATVAIVTDAAVPIDATVAVAPKPKPKPKPSEPKPKPNEPPKPTEPPKEGTIDAEAVRNVVRARNKQAQRCYEEALRKDPTLKGTVLVTFVIDLDGHAKDMKAEGLTTELQECVMKPLPKLTFPKPQGGPVTIKFPFKFEPEQAPPALPEHVASDEVVKAVQALRDKIHDCAAGKKAQVNVMLTVAPDGSVRSVQVAPAVAPELRSCIVGVIKTAKFEKSLKGTTVAVPIAIQ